MLDIRLPMPHAIPFDRPFDSFIPRPTKYASGQLPYPSTADPRSLPIRPSTTQALPSYHTPASSPPEMATLNGRLNTSQRSGVGRLGGGPSSLYATVASSSRSTNGTTHDVTKPVVEFSSPVSHRHSRPSQDLYTRKAPSNDVAPALRIPSTINAPQRSMDQLAAEITCLFWFENSSTLNQAQRPSNPPLPVQPLDPDAIPTTGFRKWVATILSTTQVAQNVILLALLFIYRLKKANPAVKGKPGSEYRLLTVALMLGNKFLDDNTYTNKTWAEVSGISVLEVHIMEVEFLSNMKYDLFTSKKSWEDWHILLGKFGTFFDRATRVVLEPSRNLAPPASALQLPQTLPSPPSSNHASPPFDTRRSPHDSLYSNTPLLHPQVESAAVSPMGLASDPTRRPRAEILPTPNLDTLANGRKRSYDEQTHEPPSKRPAHTLSYGPYSTNAVIPATTAPTLPRLRLPSLSIPPSQGITPPVQVAPHLPPPTSRAMAMVYPPTSQWSQPPPASAAPSTSHHTPIASIAPLSELSRQLSPFPTGSANSSPVSATFAQSQTRLSPSIILAQRNSPYRPVQKVHTLLRGPPSAYMQGVRPQINYSQMQYQPLGRQNERHTGPVPYMHTEAWPETHQFNQWPILPQPVPQQVLH